jgi:hypothetical protein
MGSGSGSGLGFGVVIHTIHIMIIVSMVSLELSPQVELCHFPATGLDVSAKPLELFLWADCRGFSVVMVVPHFLIFLLLLQIRNPVSRPVGTEWSLKILHWNRYGVSRLCLPFRPLRDWVEEYSCIHVLAQHRPYAQESTRLLLCGQDGESMLEMEAHWPAVRLYCHQLAPRHIPTIPGDLC